jgi:cell division protein FtsQ
MENAMDEKNNDLLPSLIEDNSVEEINRDAQSEYKDKKIKRRIRFTVFAVLAGLVLFCVITLITVGLFFKIEKITVVGNNYYDETFLLETIGLEKGDSIFLANQNEYANKLGGVCPMIYSVRVDKNYPSEITVIITEETPSYKFEFNGICAVVSKTGKVLYTTNGIPDFDGWNELVEVIPPPILEAVMGYKIRYADGVDEKVVPMIIDAIEKSPLDGKIERISIESRFDIRLQYTDRFEILVGNKDNVSVKLKFADKIIEKLKDDEKGQINVKNAKEGFAVLD